MKPKHHTRFITVNNKKYLLIDDVIVADTVVQEKPRQQPQPRKSKSYAPNRNEM